VISCWRMLGGWKRGKGLLMKLILRGGISLARIVFGDKGNRGIVMLIRLVNKCMLVYGNADKARLSRAYRQIRGWVGYRYYTPRHSYPAISYQNMLKWDRLTVYLLSNSCPSPGSNETPVSIPILTNLSLILSACAIGTTKSLSPCKNQVGG